MSLNSCPSPCTPWPIACLTVFQEIARAAHIFQVHMPAVWRIPHVANPTRRRTRGTVTGPRVRWQGTACVTAAVSNNFTAQTSSGRGETWVASVGKACDPPPPALSPIPHQLCSPGQRERHAAEAHWPHDAVGRELGSAGAVRSRASPGGHDAPTTAYKTSSVLPSRSRNRLAAGQQLWPQASQSWGHCLQKSLPQISLPGTCRGGQREEKGGTSLPEPCCLHW